LFSVIFNHVAAVQQRMPEMEQQGWLSRRERVAGFPRYDGPTV
jgi:hypothetical protein